MSTQMKFVFSPKELTLMGATALVVPMLGMVVHGAVKMRAQEPAFAEDPAMPKLSDLRIGVLFALMFVVLRKISSIVLLPLGRLLLAPGKRESLPRVQRFTNVLFRFLYFSTIAVIGHEIVKDKEWMPTQLGGAGSTLRAFDNLTVPPSRVIKFYYYVQFGYHFHSLIYTAFFTPIRNDFWEMILHHLATVILIGGSYVTNYTAIGAIIEYLHDIGDVTGYACKTVVDTGHKVLTAVLYFLLLAAWGYTRLIVLPVYLVYPATFVVPVANPNISMEFLRPIDALLCVLVCLHAYWYFLFLQMGYRLLFKGVAEDIQDHIEDGKELECVDLDAHAKKQ